MKCPKCGKDTMVYDTRLSTGNVVRRRRKCVGKKCAMRFTTFEEQCKVNAALSRARTTTLHTHQQAVIAKKARREVIRQILRDGGMERLLEGWTL